MLVKARAKAMQTASDEVPSGLMTVFLSRESNLNQAMLYAREYCKQKLDMKDPVCSIANYLFVETKVIGGNMEASSSNNLLLCGYCINQISKELV